MFKIIAKDRHARCGQIDLSHGMIETPVFMPVGTQGTVKAISVDTLKKIGFKIILGNTYHLYLRPGTEILNKIGGLNNFMKWDRPILTDSGGFQIMSLSKLMKIEEGGVKFQSHIDGKEFYLSPDISMKVQDSIGSDIHMILDQCIEFDQDISNIRKAMNLSLKWAEMSKKSFVKKKGRMLFGIIQGGTDQHLREHSAIETIDIGFDGYAIGGLAVGEGHDLMLKTLDFTIPNLPDEKPRYLMGVGTPEDLVESVKRGVDMFDCVMPTRAGRHGLAYTKFGAINLRNSKFSDDMRPIDEESGCPIASEYSRSYLHHLIKSKEILAAMLISEINLNYYNTLMVDLRLAIRDNRLDRTIEVIKGDWATVDA
ncbi:MAG: tRNA guanosine(34) transglycosylase Tgt [Hyphomicrobiales bacterium]|nr:MAG: tRNA guanosine(34) transglycosylase Tgt [Hyphomicrobiales bacterium]